MDVPQLDPTANRNAAAALADAGTSPNDRGPVLIAGAGIGGLASALALARRGIASHVLERRAAFDEEGAGIQIGPNGTRILRALGVDEALRPHIGTPERLRVRDGHTGAQLALLPLGRWIADRHGAPYWVVHRKDLHTALLEAARTDPLITLTMDFAAGEVAFDNDRVAVTDARGSAKVGRALIAADGIGSSLRTRLFEGAQPRFYGKSASRAVVPIDVLPAEFHRSEVTIWLFPDAHVVHYPVSGERELAVIVVLDDTRNDCDWNTPVEASAVLRNMPSRAPELEALMLAVENWKRWSLRTLPVPQRLVRGPVALLGDAAHPMLPFLAQGGVMALEDAMVMADMLAVWPDDVAAALSAYERRRRARATRVVAASQRNGAVYHLGGVAGLARNLALRFMPAQRLMAGFDWLYGWHADQ
ncbi:MAG TPA: FAD-dependent monooxygenase [Hyphomicrobium sp.]|nr:FAD-dependent monooxygenase [Hyphomicrobium sp.]